MTQKVQRSTIVYIDGFNFYYGALKQYPELKWLDYSQLAQRILPKHQIRKVKYFTSRVRDRANDTGVAQRQDTYIRALTVHSHVEVYLGQFKRRKRMLPLAKGYTSGNVEMVRVIQTQEKGSDVSLGAHLVRDACHKSMGVALVLSNDSDLQTPVAMAEEENITVITVNPHAHTDQPRRLLSSQNRTFNRRLLVRSQLPNPVTTETGAKIYRPREWSDAQKPA